MPLTIQSSTSILKDKTLVLHWKHIPTPQGTDNGQRLWVAGGRGGGMMKLQVDQCITI